MSKVLACFSEFEKAGLVPVLFQVLVVSITIGLIDT